MSACRLCGELTVHRHHVVHRRLGGDDASENLITLCPSCHQDVHDRRVDLLPYLDPDTGPNEHPEQAHAAQLIGLERAHRLLAPSVYRRVAA